MFEKVKCMLQWQELAYRKKVDSQWQWVEYWYPIRIVFKVRWELADLKDLKE